MRQLFFLCTGFIVLAVLVSGCTGPSATTQGVQPAAAQAQQVTGSPAVTPTAATSLVGTHWQLGWFDDTKGMWSKVAEGSTITAKFSADGKLRGFSGCSDYITDYQVTETPKIWFKRPAVSEKECQTPNGVMSQESAYFTDLEWSQTYAIKDGQLLLFDKTSRKILQFDPAP